MAITRKLIVEMDVTEVHSYLTRDQPPLGVDEVAFRERMDGEETPSVPLTLRMVETTSPHAPCHYHVGQRYRVTIEQIIEEE